jgi:ribosomal protein S17E
VDEKKFLVTTDAEAFKQAAEELVEKFAKELKRRYAQNKEEK